MPYGETTKIIRKSDSLLHHQSKNYSVKVGIYGWRKRCLYLLILALMVMMIINLALTLWILKVMDFNMVSSRICTFSKWISILLHSQKGMGQLRIVPGGLELLGQATISDSLYASTLKSKRGQPITIESSRNFTILSRDDKGKTSNNLFIGTSCVPNFDLKRVLLIFFKSGNDKMECSTNSLRITDTRGSLLFAASPGGVEVGADSLKVSGAGGAVFGGSIQTPLVRSSPGNQLMWVLYIFRYVFPRKLGRMTRLIEILSGKLRFVGILWIIYHSCRLESPTRSVEMKVAQSIGLESRAGDITASCLSTLRLESIAGSVSILTWYCDAADHNYIIQW
jgi:hypothetical protein